LQDDEVKPAAGQLGNQLSLASEWEDEFTMPTFWRWQEKQKYGS